MLGRYPLDYPLESPDLTCGIDPAGLITGDPQTNAESSWEAIMASLVVVLILTAIAFGALTGIFLKVSFAIRSEDRVRGSLQFDPTNGSTRAARALVGISGSRWE
jgi:hypothetical protein